MVRHSDGLLLLSAMAVVALSGCGIATAPLSIPVAVVQNKWITLEGEVVDEDGKPLDDVFVNLKMQFSWWGPLAGQHCGSWNKTVMVNRRFHLVEFG